MEPNLLPEEARDFRRLCSDLDLGNEELPVSPVNRKLTDTYFLLAFLSYMLLTISCTSYTLYYSDIRRGTGYDNCGNICVEKNKKYPGSNCTGKYMTAKSVAFNGTCVENNNYTFENSLDNTVIGNDRIDTNQTIEFIEKSTSTFSNTSLPEEYNSYFSEVLNEVLYTLLTASLSCLALCVGTILLLRYATSYAVWTILGLAVICLFYIAVNEWREIILKDPKGSVISATVSTIGWFCLLCIVVFMRKNVPLVILIIKESTTALFDMPLIFGVSILASVMPPIIYGLAITNFFFVLISGKLTQLDDGTLAYTLGTWQFISLLLTIPTVLWTVDFVYCIQYMIISGAIGKWYFTKDKALIGNPVRTSTYVMFRYHLGSVAVGSAITTSVSVLKIILHFLEKNRKIMKMTECCLKPIMILLSILSKSSCVLVALHGISFFKAGIKYSKLIKLNICNVIALSYMGSIVIKVVQFVVIGFSMIMTFFIIMIFQKYDIEGGFKDKNANIAFFIIVIAIIVLYFITWTILGSIEIALTTLFICFCEDYMSNDGVNNPYAMSRSLMEFIDKTRKSRNIDERFSEVS